jgi:RNA polymerase sigma-70 factor, ECF subfamily
MFADDKRSDRFLELLRPIQRELEIYSSRMVWDDGDAEDAIQNATIRAFQAFDRYRDATNFRAWVFKILTHEIFALNRKYARIAKLEFRLDPLELEALPALEQAAEYHDWLLSPGALDDALDDTLLRALKTLSENERSVLLLRGIAHFRYAEIAEALDMPLGSVMGFLARARRQMREAIRRSYQRNLP